jgi:hypothetical protein
MLWISYHRLEYYQYAFVQEKLSGIVDRSKVYGPGGMHNLGPNGNFVT